MLNRHYQVVTTVLRNYFDFLIVELLLEKIIVFSVFVRLTMTYDTATSVIVL